MENNYVAIGGNWNLFPRKVEYYDDRVIVDLDGNGETDIIKWRSYEIEPGPYEGTFKAELVVVLNGVEKVIRSDIGYEDIRDSKVINVMDLKNDNQFEIVYEFKYAGVMHLIYSLVNNEFVCIAACGASVP